MSQELIENKKTFEENNILDKDIFQFVKNSEKLQKLINANEVLKINKHNHKKIIFVYSAPKVGSTAIVSSLRIFGIKKLDIIHIHDEKMLEVLANIKDISINEIILFNKYLGKDIYVINVYRSPIEKKISAFFEKIGCYHFNVDDVEVNKYDITKVMNRFNNIFYWIGNGDHFIDKYNIKIPDKFDYINKYLLVLDNGIKYITLRLKDSNEWGRIMSDILGFNIQLIKDYEGSNKQIKDLYNKFKLNYKIPINLLNDIMNDKYLNYYYSEDEVKSYRFEWLVKSSEQRQSYSFEEYKLYENICMENCHFDKIQLNHYFDEGCTCKACSIKRYETICKILKGIEVREKIEHREAKNEWIQKRVMRANNINNYIKRLPLNVVGKDFKNDMKSIVSKGNNIHF